MPFRKSGSRVALGTLLAVSCLGAALPSAASAATCPAERTSKPFAWLLDFNDYFTAPGGDFEAGDPAWTLASGARLSSSLLDLLYTDRRLELRSGASATSPAFCVDKSRTHLRAGVESGLGGSLKWEAVYNGRTYPLSTLSWVTYTRGRISEYVPLSTAVGLTGTVTGSVKLKVTAVSGSWSVDGVAIDPRASR